MKLIFESAGTGQKYSKESLKILAIIFDKVEESLAKEYWKIITSNLSQTALLAAANFIDATVVGTEPRAMVDAVIDALFVGELARYSKEFSVEWKPEAFFDDVERNPDFLAQHLKVIESLVVAITEEAGHCALDHQKIDIAANHLIEAIQRDAELNQALRKMNVDVKAFLPPRRVPSAKKSKVVPSQWADTTVSTVRYQAQGVEEDLLSILNFSAIWRRYAALVPDHPAPSLPSPEQLANGDCIQFGGVRQSGSYYALWLHEGSMPWSTVENWDEEVVTAFFSVACHRQNGLTSAGSVPPQHDCFLIAHQDEYGYSLPTPFSLFSPDARTMPVRMGMAPMAVIPVHLDGHLLLPGSYWHRLVEAIKQVETDELYVRMEFDGTSWTVEFYSDGDREEMWRSRDWTAQVQIESGYSITISQGSGHQFEECRDLLANHVALASQPRGR